MNKSINILSNLPIILFYFLICFSMLCGGNFRAVGPLTLRHLSMIALFGLYIFTPNKYLPKKELQLKMYIAYLVIYTLCNLVNGEVFTHKFLQSLYTYHVPCLALIFGLPAIIKSKVHLRCFLLALLGLYFFNVVLTILQYMNSSWAWAIATAISSSAEEGMENAEMYTNAVGGLLGYSIVAGAFGFVVTNGYFLTSYLPVITNRINSDKFWDVVISSAFLIVGGLAIFLTQQRMAFILLLAYIVFFVYYGMKRKYRLLMWVLLILIVIFYWDYSTSIDLGRLSADNDNSNRLRLFDDFNDFLSTGNWMFGGAVDYMSRYHKAQHNTFLSAWVIGGVFTFVTYLVLYYRLFKESILKITHLRQYRDKFPLTISFAVASIIFLLYSTTHSEGVQTGSPLFWIVFVMASVSYKFEKSDSLL